LTLILLLSTACSAQPSSEEVAPAPKELTSASEEQAEEVTDEEEGTASNEEGESDNQEEAVDEEESSNGQDVQGFLTVSNQVGAKVFEFDLLLPESWQGIFEIQQANDEAVSFVYTGNADGREEVFSIEAMFESAWEEKQSEENAGVGITSDRGVIFIYRVTREKPYQGEEGDTFQSMVDSVLGIIATFEVRTAE
jgi:hypothetical protein